MENNFIISPEFSAFFLLQKNQMNTEINAISTPPAAAILKIAPVESLPLLLLKLSLALYTTGLKSTAEEEEATSSFIKGEKNKTTDE